MGDSQNFQRDGARGFAPQDAVADLRAQQGPGQRGMRGDAAKGGVGLILAGDFIGGDGAGRVGDGHAQAKGNLGQGQGGGVGQDGRAEARYKIADVAFGGGLGQFVQAVGAGFERGQIGLTRDKAGLQRG